MKRYRLEKDLTILATHHKCESKGTAGLTCARLMLLYWLWLGPGEAVGLHGTEPERWSFGGVMVMVVFMEWNETARRQI